MVRARSIPFALTLVAASLLGGCSVGPGRCAPHAPTSIVPTLPPAPLPDPVSDAPSPNMTRIAAYWSWDGVRWVWVPGHWVTPPPGQRWRAARTAHEGGRTVFHPGEMTCAPPAEDDDP